MSDRVRNFVVGFAGVAAGIAVAFGGIWLHAKIDGGFNDAPVVETPVVVDPEKWIILDSDSRRVESNDIEQIAGRVPVGDYELYGVPKPGQLPVHRVLRIENGGTPTPAPPQKPKPVDTTKPATPSQPTVTTKATSVTYVYEKDEGEVPPPVRTALDRINREKGIVATAIDDDTPDGDGEVPEQYRAPFAAAKVAGLPALVVCSGVDVLRVVKAPTTEDEVWGAVE